MNTQRITPAVSVPTAEVSIERPAVYIVATPIGNLADLSLRAVATLAAVDVILSEDTRHSRRLLEHYGIGTALSALHDHNEQRRVAALIDDLRAHGRACALISDAGTPLISDPGFRLVRAAHDAAVPVYAVPGACAAVAALSVAGVPSDRFVFEGFLPSQPGARAARLATLRTEARTLLFYEAPHRVAATIDALCAAFGTAREAVVARELTKRFESLYRGTLGDLRERMQNDPDATRGEFVLVVSGAGEAAHDDEVELERLLRGALRETDRRTAVRVIAAITGAARNRVYAASLRIDGGGDVEN